MLLPDPEHPEKQHQAAPSFLLDMIKEKDQIIREQSEELGQLREQLAQARRKIEQLRSGKNENIIAQVHTQTAPPLPHESHLLSLPCFSVPSTLTPSSSPK